jgi:hypothetical protein
MMVIIHPWISLYLFEVSSEMGLGVDLLFGMWQWRGDVMDMDYRHHDEYEGADEEEDE